MGKEKTSELLINKIIKLRKEGLSLNDIQKIVPVGKTTIFRYLRGIKINKDIKNTGSFRKSQRDWDFSKTIANEKIREIWSKEKMLILACLYWGEGNKRELNLINSDPNLIRIFVECLVELGVSKNELLVSIRIYEDMNADFVKGFWAKNIGIKIEQIKGVDVLIGKKEGKLKYGMCRIRVRKGGKYFKIIISMIDLIKSKI
ncbi:MAG: hypothetical protein WC229_00660 [Candidatus Paceibacterota bacterium]